MKIINGKWFFGDFANTPTVIDVFFNMHRKPEQIRKRSKITKEHNYIFKSLA